MAETETFNRRSANVVAGLAATRGRVCAFPAVVALVIGFTILADTPAAAVDHQKRVLVLYQVRHDSQLALIGNRDIPKILEAGLNASIDYYSEYLEEERFRGPDYEQGFWNFLRLKYGPLHPDLIIATSSAMVEFIARSRDNFLPDTPVVFFEGRSSTSDRLPNSTGIVSELRLDGTLDLALALQPDLRHAFVVTTSDDSVDAVERVARRQFRPFESRLTISYLTDLTRADLESRLATLPEHSMVFYFTLNRDATGDSFHPLAYVDRVSAVSNAPVYSWVDSTMDHGVVGGVLKDQREEIRQLSALALRVLKGEPADSIPPVVTDLNVAQVDWRQLRRWQIDEARVPVRTVIRFREPGLLIRYRNYLLLFLAVLVGQFALIGLLLVQRRRLRLAETTASRSQSQLRASYDRIRDLGGRLLLAQEGERSRIARELHDDIGQQLAMLSIQLDRVRIASSNLDRRGKSLIEQAVKCARNMSRNLHDLSHRLHPTVLGHVGIADALRGMLDEASSPTLQVSFAHNDVPPALPQDVTLCVFRIAQEALQNVIRHSQASHASITLTGSETELLLKVEDDGVGFDAEGARHEGLGLISMAERLEAIDGLMSISSQPGAGTRLTVVVPLRGRTAKPAAVDQLRNHHADRQEHTAS